MIAVLAVIVLGGIGVGVKLFSGDSGAGSGAGAGDGIRIPTFSALARTGEGVFNGVCAQCHGKNAAGTDRGPSLLHPFYNPGHHGDAAFFMAAQNGVRAHHWQFGDMPPQPDVSRADVAAIVRYVRELQEANGIVAQKHVM